MGAHSAISDLGNQYALPHHAGGVEQNGLHDLMNASRSALIVAASVVGMPCGNPL
jgi:hypothetical protein